MMTYEKPIAEIIRFGENDIFMTASGNINPADAKYETAQAAVAANCPQYTPSGNSGQFKCEVFMGYSQSNFPKNGTTVSIGGGQYVFEATGNHWKPVK